MGNQEPAPKSSRPKDPCGGTIPARFDPSTREETWPNDGKSMENPWKIHGKLEKLWQIHGKSMENDGKTLVLDVLGVLKRIGYHFSDLEVLPKYEAMTAKPPLKAVDLVSSTEGK